LSSAAAWAAVAGTAAVGIGAVLPPYLVAHRLDPHRALPHRVTNLLWGRAVLGLGPWWDVQVRGRRHLPTTGACLLCANHQSFVDVLALHRLGIDFKWVLHHRFERVPVLASWMRWSGYVAVDPDDPVSARQMLAGVERWLGRGMPVALFPEGTRSADGQVAPLKRGPFRAAIAAGAPVIPVAIDGTRPVLPRDRWLAAEPPPWQIRVHVLPPLALSAEARAPEAARACGRALREELTSMRAGTCAC
jgi:1-acyl-sn-glycerol-3-phosphate acyltransferase